MKEIKTPLVQRGMGACHARVKLAWQALRKARDKIAHSKDGKAILDEVARGINVKTAHCKYIEVVLDEVACNKDSKATLGEAACSKDGEAMLGETTHGKIYAGIRHGPLGGGIILSSGNPLKNSMMV